jgi:serine/threonine protein kinase
MANVLTVHYRNPNYASFIAAYQLDDMNTVFKWSHGEVVRKRAFRWLVRDYLDGLGHFYIKRYDYPKANMRYNFVGSNALREWTNSKRMQQLGIPQPDIVVVATRKNFWGVTGSFIITREVAAARSLDKLLEDPIDRPEDEMLDMLATSLVNMIRQMHSGGFSHRDLKARNLLISQFGTQLKLIPIDSLNGRSLNLLTRRRCIRRDYRFLLNDAHLGQLIAAKIK